MIEPQADEVDLIGPLGISSTPKVEAELELEPSAPGPDVSVAGDIVPRRRRGRPRGRKQLRQPPTPAKPVEKQKSKASQPPPPPKPSAGLDLEALDFCMGSTVDVVEPAAGMPLSAVPMSAALETGIATIVESPPTIPVATPRLDVIVSRAEHRVRVHESALRRALLCRDLCLERGLKPGRFVRAATYRARALCRARRWLYDVQACRAAVAVPEDDAAFAKALNSKSSPIGVISGRYGEPVDDRQKKYINSDKQRRHRAVMQAVADDDVLREMRDHAPTPDELGQDVWVKTVHSLLSDYVNMTQELQDPHTPHSTRVALRRDRNGVASDMRALGASALFDVHRTSEQVKRLAERLASSDSAVQQSRHVIETLRMHEQLVAMSQELEDGVSLDHSTNLELGTEDAPLD